MELNTTNPHCFIYQTEELLIELLGGVKIDGLDRMRVTMKVTLVNRKHSNYLNNPELVGLSVRHNLDLYNDTQVEKFVRRVAEKLETGSIAITRAISDITSQLEQYRLQQLDKQETRKEKALSKEEREEAIQFLEQKDLLQKTNEMIGKSGVIGEETNRLLMYLIFTSRKREHPLHVISLGNSGIGKTYLQEKVGELIPVFYCLMNTKPKNIKKHRRLVLEQWSRDNYPLPALPAYACSKNLRRRRKYRYNNGTIIHY